MRVRRFLHFLLFFVVCLLLWRLVETWRRPLEGQRSASQQNATEETPLPSFPTPPPQTGKRYADIIAEKDLFTPSRSRAQTETKTVATIPPPSHLKLVGVMLAHGREEAFFADSTQGGKVVRIRKGESLGSYKLVNVAPLQATLTMGQDGGDEVSLPLLVLDSNTAGQAQRLMPQARGNQARLAQQQARQLLQPTPGRPGVPPPADAPQTETHAIRQNIQQLQQRLRQIRRQAARDSNPEEEEEAEEAEEEEEEEEE